LRTSTPRNLFVDRYYGLAYDREVIQQTAPYGITELMPDQAVDGMQNSGFLRIPFRKIPRRLVRDRDELLAAVSLATGDTAGLDIVYRGQEREYYLPRQAVVRELLYEDPEAREPSLLPSSARRTVEFEAALVEWCSLVGLYLAEIARLPSDPDVARVLSDYHQQLTSSMKLYLYSLALAQHYGLPSTGLDVTDDLDVAVFFALARFEATEEEGVLRHGRRRSEDPPVLYVFAPPSRFDFEYETVAPIRDFATRPARQRARFLHGGWGLSQNAAARYLRAALYLDPTGDFGEAPSPSILFPAVTEDFCAAWLLSASRALSDSPIKRLLQASLYWVVE
jgi:hypothetical protein